MSGKKANLAAFNPPAATQLAEPEVKRRTRGLGKTVFLTVKLTREDWLRGHQLALDVGESFQTLFLQGLSKVFQEKGLPGIDGY